MQKGGVASATPPLLRSSASQPLNRSLSSALWSAQNSGASMTAFFMLSGAVGMCVALAVLAARAATRQPGDPQAMQEMAACAASSTVDGSVCCWSPGAC